MFVPEVLQAQLSAPSANSVRYTSYPSSKDPIYVFCNSTGDIKGSLTAISPFDAASNKFVWYRWSDDSNSFSIHVKTDDGVTASTVADLDEGGYKVIITNTIDTTDFIGWIFLDKPYAGATLMNNGCDYVALDGTAVVDTFIYRDPVNGSTIELPNAVRHLWSSSPSSSIPYPDLRIDPYTYTPPLEDVTYKIEVTDSMMCSSEASFFYESIHVKAALSSDVQEGEAPLEVNFSNESIRATSFSWDFGDDTEKSILETPETHTFYRPGKYTISLAIESDLHCADTDSTSLVITVNPSTLKIPNAFTPNEDGYNDRFIVEKSSLRYLSVQIFSNSGVKVYNFTGDTEGIQNWDGWDGTINHTSRKAAPGVYYYIIKAVGWDDVEYEGREYRDFVYLYR